MSKPAVPEELKSALGRMAKDVRRFAPQAPISQYPELEFPAAERQMIENILKGMEELEGVETKTLRSVTWASSLSISTIARSLLERLSLGDIPETIVADLLDFFKKGSHDTYYLAGVGGVQAQRSVELSKNVKLAIMEDVPSSAAREFVFRIDRFHRIKGSIGHEIPRPKVALVVRTNQEVITSPRNAPKGNLTSETRNEIEARILMCVTLAGKKAAPVITAKTSWIDHPAQSYHGLTGFGAGTSPAQQYPTAV
jgi:hypothetical protein